MGCILSLRSQSKPEKPQFKPDKPQPEAQRYHPKRYHTYGELVKNLFDEDDEAYQKAPKVHNEDDWRGTISPPDRTPLFKLRALTNTTKRDLKLAQKFFGVHDSYKWLCF